MNRDLPKGWARAPINELIELVLGGDWGQEPVQNIPPGFMRAKVIRGTDFKLWDSNKADYAAERLLKESSLEKRVLKDGDLILEVSGAGPDQPVGRTVLIDKDTLDRSSGPLVCSNFFRLLRLKRSVSPSYLAYYLKYAYGRGQFNEFQTQTTNLRNLNVRDYLHGTVVKIAPLSEQARIAARLKILSSQVASCRMHLQRVPVLMKRFRQSAIAAACSGRLTADWRERNAGTMCARNLISLLKSPPPERHFDTFEKSSNMELPQSWEWVRLGELGPILGGGTPSKDKLEYWNGDIPWVTPKDMKRDCIQDSEDHITERAVQDSHLHRIPAGSILFVVRGMILNHTFPTAVTDRVVTVNQDMKALVPELPEMSEYLVLVSKHIASAILFEVKEATHGTRRIETALLKNWAIPVPPLPEQREIVRRVEALSSLADRIQARYAKAEQQAGKLTQSVLAKAFRGELVPTEAELAEAEGRDYESAEELLQRFKGESPAEQPTKRNRTEIGKSPLMVR